MRVSVGQCTTGEFCTSSPSVSACDRPKNVSLDLLTGASSAFMGTFASPSISAQAIAAVPQKLNGESPPIDYEYMAKWGLRNLAPLLGGYRLLDGGYTEQTGVAFTLATMQRDARPGEPLKIIVVNNDACYPDAGNEASTRQLFANPPLGDRLAPCSYDPFTRTVCPNQTASGEFQRGTISEMAKPIPQMFAEPYPADGQWQTFLQDPKVTGKCVGRSWEGKVTTVDNPWFNVKGGTEVSLIILNPNIRNEVAPILPVATDFPNPTLWVPGYASATKAILKGLEANNWGERFRNFVSSPTPADVGVDPLYPVGGP